MPGLPQLVRSVQHNCDVSDSRHAGDYGLCTFLLRMREYYRWENELPFGRALPKDDLGEWLTERELGWSRIEGEDFVPLRLGDAEIDAFEAEAANRALLPCGLVYSAGYGSFHKPVFFLGRLLRVEERAGLTILVSSCEYARELAAPPAMLQGRTIFLRQESARRYLWEKIEEWQWRKQDNAMARTLAGYGFGSGPEAALQRMADDLMENMLLHEIGEAAAAELLGEPWREFARSLARTRGEAIARALRDLLADCLSTLPGLLDRPDRRGLDLYFATFDAPRRQLFPQALEAYDAFTRGGDSGRLEEIVREGTKRWLATARELLDLDPGRREEALGGLLDEGAPAHGVGCGASQGPHRPSGRSASS